MNRLMGLRLNLRGPIREGDLKKKKVSCEGCLIASLINLMSIYTLGYSVQFTYLLSLIDNRDISLRCLYGFNQGTGK